MNENETPLIGTPVNVTLFVVEYEYTKPPRVSKLPKSAKKDIEKVQNSCPIVTGDPSGEDVHKIAKLAVLGANPYEGHDFRVLSMRRICDAIGLGQVTSWEKLGGQAPSDASDPETQSKEDDENGDGGDGSNGSGSIPPGAHLN